MAWSDPIYVCTDSRYLPIGAYTDKAQCKIWLRTEMAARLVYWVHVFKDGDNRYSVPVWRVEDFLSDC